MSVPVELPGTVQHVEAPPTLLSRAVRTPSLVAGALLGLAMLSRVGPWLASAHVGH